MGLGDFIRFQFVAGDRRRPRPKQLTTRQTDAKRRAVNRAGHAEQGFTRAPLCCANEEIEEKRLTRYPHPEVPSSTTQSDYPRFEQLMKQILPPAPKMPAPILTFDGMNSSQSGCGCLPPDPNGDVGPNHYVQSVNSSIKIFDKNGTPSMAPTARATTLCSKPW
jgi:hypothetical protein